MPTYEYECTRCGQVTSEFKPMSAPRRQRCPACRGKVELLISGGLGVVFKGDGFYINDSRKARGNGSQGSSSQAAKPADPAGSGTAKAPADSGTVHDSGAKGKDKGRD